MAGHGATPGVDAKSVGPRSPLRSLPSTRLNKNAAIGNLKNRCAQETGGAESERRSRSTSMDLPRVAAAEPNPFGRNSVFQSVGITPAIVAMNIASTSSHMGQEDTFECITVRLHAMSGRRLLEFVGDPQSTVRQLKVRIADCLQIPPLCQKLVVGTHVLQDFETLGAHCCRENASPSEHAVLPTTLVVSAEEAFNLVAEPHTDPVARRSAAESICQVAHLDYERATDALQSCCLERDQRLRHIALKALSRVAKPEDNQVLTTFRKHLDHQDFFDRRIALEAFARLLERCDVAPAKHASRPSSSSRKRAASPPTHPRVDQPLDQHSMVRLFTSAVSKGNPCGIPALCACLEDSDEAVRRGASGALLASVPRGDDQVVAHLRKHLQRASGRAKLPFVETLSQIAVPDDALAISIFCRCLEDWDEGVRAAAISALSRVVQRGNANAINSIVAHLEHTNDWARRAAIAALVAVVSATDLPHAIPTVARLLEHADDRVRCAAMEALSKITRHGDERVVEALTARLDHANESIRRSSARFLAGFRVNGQERAASATSCSNRRATTSGGGLRSSTMLASASSLLQPLPPPRTQGAVGSRLSPTVAARLEANSMRQSTSTTSSPSSALSSCGRRFVFARGEHS